MLFLDRPDAGRRLASRLEHLEGRDVAVVGLPRGGVPVAVEVARTLGAPLDVVVVRKLGVPFQPELAMGAIGEEGARFVDGTVVTAAGVTSEELADVEGRERAEVQRRARRFRRGRPRVPLDGRTVVVVDDGIATGSTARAACQAVRALGARRIVLAVPVAPPGWKLHMADVADELVALATPAMFRAVGQWYEDFTQVSDEEVTFHLRRAESDGPGPSRPAPVVPPAPRAGPGAGPPGSDPPGPRAAAPAHGPPRAEEVEIPAGPVGLAGRLAVPQGATGLVVVAHGSGSSRNSPRNRYVAAILNRAGLGTLLFDLLTPGEEIDRANVFDIELQAGRLLAATEWLRQRPEGRDARIGYFGAGTGSAAALRAAAEPSADVAAVVSRGGRLDLVEARLPAITAPTLLVVGGGDRAVLDLNRRGQQALCCQNRLAVVPGATHLFDEPGALARVAVLASDWFVRHLIESAPSQARAG